MATNIAAHTSNQLITEFKEPLVIKKSVNDALESVSDSSISPTKKIHRRKKCRRSKHGKYAPYSARHFLGRPKINAPANTNQFIFEDKDIGLDKLFDSDRRQSDESYSSDCDSAVEGKKSEINESNGSIDEMYTYEGSSGYEDSHDRFLVQDFDRMYDDARAEMLRNESIDELTSRCMDLETAIHNMNYLYQKEVQTRHKMEQIMFLHQQNDELRKENARYREIQDHKVQENIVSQSDAASCVKDHKLSTNVDFFSN